MLPLAVLTMTGVLVDLLKFSDISMTVKVAVAAVPVPPFAVVTAPVLLR